MTQPARFHLPQLDDAKVQEDAPTIRAELVRRLEYLWGVLQPYMEPSEDRRPDPRYVEAGIRVLDRLMRLYRLDAPGMKVQSEVAGFDLVAEVERGLRELEQRLR